jgi:hypothetical protein
VRIGIDFPTVLVGAALILTCTAGALGSARAGGTSRDRAGDALLRAEIAERGWVSLPSPGAAGSPASPASTQGVDLMCATRPFSLHLGNGVVEGDPASPAALARATRIVDSELARYAPDLLHRAGLGRVLFTATLREGGRAIPSLPNCAGTLLLDVDAPDAFLRRLVHHEVFHFIDLADDGVVRHDPRWESLNERFFVYGDGGRSTRDPRGATLTDTLPGFLNAYSLSGVEEDKAEVFSFLMTSPREVERIAKDDVVLTNKTVLLREQLAHLAGASPSPLPPPAK